MFNTLEKLRTKSRGQRSLIAFSVSLFFTGLIFVTWFTVEKKPKISAEIAKKIENNTPTDTLARSMKDVWDSIVSTTKDAKESIKSLELSSTVEIKNQASSTLDE